ncbi:MAG: hypothetical protein GF344_06240 [Chitinivibrionales bacterium]|nr:hypothetical protein [Chitinivibrionales bacterium]MBD3356532.1 hypothetical protein [Chitinivibrionales bacterium]
MEERGSLTRLRPYYYLRVYETENDEIVGSAYDLSFEGIRLIANRTFEWEKTYRLRLRLPEDSFFGDMVELDAVCTSCRGVAESDSYDCGFNFPDKAGPAITPLTALLKDLAKQGRLVRGNPGSS